MSIFPQKRVMDLVCPVTHRIHPVLFWSDFGVVVPTLWPTSGNIPYVAELISSWVRVGSITVSRSALPGMIDFSSELAVRHALGDAYREWNQRVA